MPEHGAELGFRDSVQPADDPPYRLVPADPVEEPRPDLSSSSSSSSMFRRTWTFTWSSTNPLAHKAPEIKNWFADPMRARWHLALHAYQLELAEPRGAVVQGAHRPERFDAPLRRLAQPWPGSLSWAIARTRLSMLMTVAPSSRGPMTSALPLPCPPATRRPAARQVELRGAVRLLPTADVVSGEAGRRPSADLRMENDEQRRAVGEGLWPGRPRCGLGRRMPPNRRSSSSIAQWGRPKVRARCEERVP